MVRQCVHCTSQRAVLRRPKTAEPLCRECFYAALEQEVHETISAARLFKPGERVAVAASGGKDSTVLAHMLTTLNARHGCVARQGQGSVVDGGCAHACGCGGAAVPHF